jgi:hypothetical protein
MTASFRAALAKAGLAFDGEIIADGKFHHFKAAGDKRPSSWFVLFPANSVVPAAGAFGCWKRGSKET